MLLYSVGLSALVDSWGRPTKEKGCGATLMMMGGHRATLDSNLDALTLLFHRPSRLKINIKKISKFHQILSKNSKLV